MKICVIMVPVDVNSVLRFSPFGEFTYSDEASWSCVLFGGRQSIVNHLIGRPSPIFRLPEISGS